MKGSGKVSRRRYYLTLAFVIFLPIFFAVLQIWAAFRVISLYGWHREPVFWAGAIVWSIMGYFLHELKALLRKKAVAALVFSLSLLTAGHLAKTGEFPIALQFMMWGPLSVVMAGARAFVEEDLLKKYENVHGAS